MARCTAKSKRTGVQCGNFCSPGKTVCRFHGGASSGAPKGNKNALVHGAYELITLDTMNQDEIDYANSVSLDAETTLKEQLKILRVRELKIMRRIKKTQDAEAIAGTKDADGKTHTAFVVVGGQRSQTVDQSGGKTSSVTTTEEAHVTHILKLEHALTLIQDQIRRVLDSLGKLALESGKDDMPLPLYTEDPYV